MKAVEQGRRLAGRDRSVERVLHHRRDRPTVADERVLSVDEIAVLVGEPRQAVLRTLRLLGASGRAICEDGGWRAR